MRQPPPEEYRSPEAAVTPLQVTSKTLQPAPLAACVWNQRAEERLEEMELNGVASRRNGDRVAEIAMPFSGVKSGNLRRRFGILIDGCAPPMK